VPPHLAKEILLFVLRLAAQAVLCTLWAFVCSVKVAYRMADVLEKVTAPLVYVFHDFNAETLDQPAGLVFSTLDVAFEELEDPLLNLLAGHLAFAHLGEIQGTTDLFPGIAAGL
jgi:hypothetical protein